MKELSIEEKAKAYDEAARKIMDYRNGKTKMYTDVNKTLDYLFPELKESEDERIREALIELVRMVDKNPIHQIFGYGDIKYSDMIDWLEKQSDANKEYWRGYREGKKEILDKYSELEKQGEQKSAEWSEEDENRLSDAVFFVREYQIPTRDKRLLNAAKEAEEWLKSLRPHSQWKPSDEQIKAVKEAACYSSVFSEKTIDNLISLSKQLKKLREEEL